MNPSLVDNFGRKIEYLRVSVTDRCDLRCNYCMPEHHSDYAEPDEWLSFDEITRVIRLFSELGTHRIRLTGGEPLVRKHLPDLVQQLSTLPGIDDLSLSTNAVRLSRFAKPLKTAGISRLNVSIDTLDAAKFKTITKGQLSKVLAGLEAAKGAGFAPIKINMVVMAETQMQEIFDMVEYCQNNQFTLRLIETMPLGITGQTAFQKTALSFADIKQHINQRFSTIPDTMPGGGPARYIRLTESNTKIGFITPITQHFCETCNRVRLSVDGTIYTCLGQEHNFPLRPLLRDHASDADITSAIKTAIQLKPQKHEFNEQPLKLTRVMSMTGG